MNEDIEVTAGPNFDFVTDQAHTIFLQLFDGGREIVDAQRHVMQSLAALSLDDSRELPPISGTDAPPSA